MLRILLFARFLLELFQSSNGEMEVKQGDIWGLFREAQQSKSSISFFLFFVLGSCKFYLCVFWFFFWWYSDILYLNKQRLMAIEELNRANREKQLLVARIKHLEAVKQAGVGKGKRWWCLGLTWLKQWISSKACYGFILSFVHFQHLSGVLLENLGIAFIMLDKLVVITNKWLICTWKNCL